MITYTKNEQKLFNLIAEESMNGGVVDITNFSHYELTTKQVRGVISSLVKKNKIWVDDDDSHESPVFWPEHSKYGCCFWCDEVPAGEEEYILDSDLKEQA